jgi:hypothetical protein
MYLMTSYLYYERCVTVITDTDFDALCKSLVSGWRVNRHPHKHLAPVARLQEGTGYHLHGKYPLIVQHAALRLLEEWKEIGHG